MKLRSLLVPSHGVVGSPINHSMSPLLHQYSFNQLSLPFSYDAYHVEDTLPEFMEYFRAKPVNANFVPLEKPKLLGLHVPPASMLSKTIYRDYAQLSCRMGGLSVTLPHKKSIMAYVDAVTPLCEMVGAANTLYWDDDTLFGHNTDVDGFLTPLYVYYTIIPLPKMPTTASTQSVLLGETANMTASGQILTNSRTSQNPHSFTTNTSNIASTMRHDRAMILGAGGAAAAVLVGLLHIENLSTIYICARREEQARELYTHIDNFFMNLASPNGSMLKIREHLKRVKIISYADREIDVELLINTIPATLQKTSQIVSQKISQNLDSSQNPQEFPLELETGFSPRKNFSNVRIAYDLLYTKTPFLAQAQKAGVHNINGRTMFFEQGARQFQLWTNQRMPITAFEAVNLCLDGKAYIA